MPVNVNTGKSGAKKVFRTTDKCVQAEMKNKVETARLYLHKKILDRQQSHNKFMVEKDKRLAIKALGNMRKTSGLSTHGIPPEGPADRAHEKSPYFKCYRPLSEKRLLQWRAKETELERLLEQEEDILIPPWERDPNEDLGQKFAKMMRCVGFNVEDDDMMKTLAQNGEHHTKHSVPSVTGHPKDVFSCIRHDLNMHDPQNNKQPQEFSISAWGRQLMQDYKQMVADPASAAKQRRVRSAMSRMQSDGVTSSQEPHDGINGHTNGDANGLSNGYYTSNSDLRARLKVRPHTASIPQRHHYSINSTEKRPNSASTSVKPCYHRSSTLSSLTSVGSLDKSMGDDTDDVFDVNGKENSPKVTAIQNNITEPRAPLHIVKSSSAGADLSSSQARSKQLNGRSLSKSSILRNNSLSSKSDSNIKDVSPRTDNYRKLSKKDSLFLLNSVIKAEKKESRVSFSGIQEDSNGHEEHGNNGDSHDGKPLIRRRHDVTSMQHLVKMRQDSKLSELDIEDMEHNLEKLSSKHTTDMDGLFEKMPQKSNHHERQQKILLNKTERRIAMHAAHRKISTASTADVLDDLIDSDEEEEDVSTGKRMPQWKRDLMAEAPPGLFGPKSVAKVVVAMSKNQRRRELDQLVTENVSDIKKLTDNEHARRIRARLHMYFTIRKLRNAVDRISSHE